MKIEILGTGCSKCYALYSMVVALLQKNSVDAEVVKVEDIKELATRGIFLTPALIIDGETKTAGKLPKPAELQKWLLRD